jgi:hypothetical protein
VALVSQKSARELRQSGSDYRCCIPALAGFVSPQSIAPDGKETSRRPARTQSSFRSGASVKRLYNRSSERHVRFDPRHIGGMHQARFGQVPLALGALGREQMTARGVLSQHLARAGDLETFRDRFSRFAARNGLRHKARKIDEIRWVTTAFPVEAAVSGG